MQLTGTYAVIFYAVSLFKDIGVSTNPYIPAIITGKTLFYISYSFNVMYRGGIFFDSQQPSYIVKVYITASRYK